MFIDRDNSGTPGFNGSAAFDRRLEYPHVCSVRAVAAVSACAIRTSTLHARAEFANPSTRMPSHSPVALPLPSLGLKPCFESRGRCGAPFGRRRPLDGSGDGLAVRTFGLARRATRQRSLRGRFDRLDENLVDRLGRLDQAPPQGLEIVEPGGAGQGRL